MFTAGGVSAFLVAPFMAGYPLVFMKYFHRGPGIAHIHALVHQLVGHTIIMPEQLYMIIDIHLGALPFGEGIAGPRQGQEGRFIDLLKPGQAAAGKLLEGTLVHLIEQSPDGLVQFLQAKKGTSS